MVDFAQKLEFFRTNPVTDWHEHVAIGAVSGGETDERLEKLIRDMAVCGIDRVVISRPITGGTHALPEEIARANDTVGYTVERYPGKIWGLAYTDAIHGRYAVDEIDRCRRSFGAIGVKLYNQFTMDNDIQNPIIEYCIEHDMFILMHAAHLTQRPWEQAYLSGSDHICAAAKKYPAATFLMAHIGGGGDWSWQLRGLEDCPNVFCDISGSVHDAGMIEGLVRAMGTERILFGTDGSFSSSVGKLLGARISDAEKLEIMENTAFKRYLERR
ncbi:MAG: amidohydrolase family protein [Clostridiaceae bacterium]|nr:amidohydrolase family protein [Clostridiaceae bacterium]